MEINPSMETRHAFPGRKPEGKGQEEEARAQRHLQQFREAGNEDAREALVAQYRPLVEKLSRRFLPSGIPLDDLVQEGFLGLLHAIDHYDTAKNVKFITYATHCVAGQLRHFLRDRGQIIKEPAWLQELSQRVRRAADALAQTLGRQPTALEIAKSVGLPEETVADIEATRSLFSVASLEESFDDGSRTLAEREGVTEGVGGVTMLSFELPIDEKVVLEDALTRLKDLERRVIYMFYYDDRSQTEIARELGISNNYVSHILKSSARKLQQVYRSEAVRDAALQYETKRSRAIPTEEPAPVSVVDNVTGLYSRDYFNARIDEELSRAMRHHLELSVVRVAIGTDLPEATLFAKVGQTIKDTLRRSDIVARTGDHEIGALLPYTGQTCSTVAERLTIQLTALQAQFPHPFSFSVGAASYPPHRKRTTLQEAATPAKK